MRGVSSDILASFALRDLFAASSRAHSLNVPSEISEVSVNLIINHI